MNRGKYARPTQSEFFGPSHEEQIDRLHQALQDIANIRLEPGHCYEQAVRMQEIAKKVLRRGEG